MKFSEIIELSQEELGIKLNNLQEELFNIKFGSSLTKSPNPIKVRAIRKDIARIRTLLSQREN